MYHQNPVQWHLLSLHFCCYLHLKTWVLEDCGGWCQRGNTVILLLCGMLMSKPDNGLDRNNSCGQQSSCHCHVHGYSSASDGFELVVPSDRVVIFSAKPCRSYLLADFIKRYRYKLILFSLHKMCVKFFSYKFI